MFVCLCNGVTDSQIIKAINEGHDTIKKLRQHTAAMTQCGKCGIQCKQILASTALSDNTDFSTIPLPLPID